MINEEDAIVIHKTLISKFGGTDKIRDIKLLQSALARPFATFDKKELYPGIQEKASALIESIINNHPFTDGNKRTGYTLMRFYLLQNKKDIKASAEEKYTFIINIADGTYKYDKILQWIKTKLINID